MRFDACFYSAFRVLDRDVWAYYGKVSDFVACVAAYFLVRAAVEPVCFATAGQSDGGSRPWDCRALFLDSCCVLWSSIGNGSYRARATLVEAYRRRSSRISALFQMRSHPKVSKCERRSSSIACDGIDGATFCTGGGRVRLGLLSNLVPRRRFVVG